MSGGCLWSITVALSFENVCEIYTLDDTLDGAREGLEKWLAQMFTSNIETVIFGDHKNALKKQFKKDNKSSRLWKILNTRWAVILDLSSNSFVLICLVKRIVYYW